MKTLGLTFLLFFTMSLGLSSLAKAFGSTCSVPRATLCNPVEVQNSSYETPSSEHCEDSNHNHCLAHCVHFIGLLHSGDPDLYFNKAVNALYSFYAFFLSSPDLDGPFRPPLA